MCSAFSTQSPIRLAVIVAAGGSSRRYNASTTDGGAERSKLDLELGGRPVLQRTVELFSAVACVTKIIVAGPADAAAMREFKEKYSDKLGLMGVTICAGGAEHRYQTVQNALALVPESCTHVAVHDAARPCCPAGLIERLLEAAEQFDAVIPGVPVPDTLKRVSATDVPNAKADPLAAIFGAASGPTFKGVSETIDRAGVWAVQTPQIFTRELLLRAYAQANLASTDDAQLVERLGERVVIVRGDVRNIKITDEADLHLARAILNVKARAERPSHLKF